MAWRSSYLFCPDCRSVYFANQVSPVFENGKTYWRCPNAMCDAIGELVTLDELMIKPVVELNKKGYKTQYCCSGHDLRSPADQNGYIMFDRGIKLSSAPEGWDIERGESRSLLDIIIRSHIDDIGVSIANLNKWVEKLEDYHSCSNCKHVNDICVNHCSDCCDHESWEEKDEYN